MDNQVSVRGKVAAGSLIYRGYYQIETLATAIAERRPRGVAVAGPSFATDGRIPLE
jgi:hypothetical protein